LFYSQYRNFSPHLCNVLDRMKKYQIANMKNKDQRIKAMNEVLEGIKVGQKARPCCQYQRAENPAA
jgi:hypothetical protein